MNSDSLKKPVDLQGLSLALAKTKADYLGAIQNAPQSDWAQNDGDKSTYIENRTHYSYIEYYYNWLTDYEFTTTGVAKTLSWAALYDINPDLAFQIHRGGFIEGETYTVTYNGTSYELECYVFNSSTSIYYCLGDSGHGFAAMQEDTAHADTNVPFILYSTSLSLTFRTDGAGTYTVSIVGPAVIYNKLNSNYLDGRLIQYGSGLDAEVFNDPDNEASGTKSHAEGYHTVASSSYSHAEGGITIAEGMASHSEGLYTTASGYYSHAENSNTVASGAQSHAEGNLTRAFGDDSHAEGSYFYIQTTVTGEANAVTYIITSDTKPLVYNQNVIIGAAVTTRTSMFGGSPKIIEATIENNGITSFTLDKTLNASNAVSGTCYIWIGSKTAGAGAHAEGAGSYAGGIGSHSEGFETWAFGKASHTEGTGTIASGEYQHVQGKFNIIDSSGTYAEIVGNGTGMLDENRSNARTLDWSGNEVLAGKLTVGAAPTADMDVATKAYVDSATSGITTNLAGLTDTTINSPADGQVLKYDGTNEVWVNGDAGGAYYITLSSTTTDGTTTYTADKTFAEAEAAYNAGKTLYMVNGSNVYALTLFSSAGMAFGKNTSSALQHFAWTKSSGSIVYTSSSLANYQSKLTFDSAPTSGSTNPVTSGGIYTAIDEAANAHTLSISENIITLTLPDGSTSSVSLPIYNGNVTDVLAMNSFNTSVVDDVLILDEDNESIIGS